MDVWAIVQARMSSQRLPGKVLTPVQGRPLLDYVIERVKACSKIRKIVVATSTDRTDHAVAAYAAERGLLCSRGPLDDVAARFLGAVRDFHIPAFVRVNADSPALDPLLLDRAVRLFQENPRSVVTNTFKRSFPKGQSVEIVASDIFADAYPKMDSSQREHIMTYFYKNPDQFSILNFENEGENLGAENISIDVPADLLWFEKAVKEMQGPYTQASWAHFYSVKQRLLKGASK